MAASPFHAGERAAQARAGAAEQGERLARGIRDFMPDQHRELFTKLPFVLLGSLDEQGRPWASLLTGDAGFVSSPSPRALVVAARPLPGDALRAGLRPGAALGLLGIELPTRRRNRANGKLLRVSEDGFELLVEQSFGNCPKYIQARSGAFTPAALVAWPEPEHQVLSARAERVLARCDTSFIATRSAEPERGGAEGVDVSHRGGPAGFIRVRRVAGASVLTLPDYRGNFMFNTFGNLEQDPRAGLLALGFETGELLSLTGTARVLWEGAELAASAGAERLLELRVESGLLWRDVARGFSAPEPSPYLPQR